MKNLLFIIFLIAILFNSCKPKQSFYKKIYESAKEREMLEDSGEIFSKDSKASEFLEKQEKIEPVNSSDDSNIKKYNVVIAAFSVKLNAENLKNIMEKEGYNNVIIAKNEESIYRVILSSYDDKQTAINNRQELYEKYNKIGLTEDLKSKYGITFNDLWILERVY